MNAPLNLPNTYLTARQNNVRAALKTMELDGLLLTHPPDLAYLTGFTGHDSIGIITDEDVFLVTDFRYETQVRREAPWLKADIREDVLPAALARRIIASGVKRLGFEANFTTVGQINATREKMDGASAEFAPVDDLMVNLRKIKDDREIALIRKSIDIAQQAYTALRAQVRVGISENELAGRLIAELRGRGAEGTSFDPIVAAASNSALPHYRAGDTRVQQDQFLLIDWGCIYQGYCSDLTRTLLIGNVSGKLREIYKICLDAQLAAIAFLKPGVTTHQADRVAREYIGAAGHGREFGHGLGHGIGRDIHELPALRWNATDEPLQPGMVVTVEPGIYLPEQGGVRIEDDVLITQSGCEVLSSLDKSLESCHIH